tara:strand:+ start:833 stop:2035 length:1203 start_codon:yes stop_codon:yes gene_type:complete
MGRARNIFWSVVGLGVLGIGLLRYSPKDIAKEITHDSDIQVYLNHPEIPGKEPIVSSLCEEELVIIDRIFGSGVLKKNLSKLEKTAERELANIESLGEPPEKINGRSWRIKSANLPSDDYTLAAIPGEPGQQTTILFSSTLPNYTVKGYTLKEDGRIIGQNKNFIHQGRTYKTPVTRTYTGIIDLVGEKSIHTKPLRVSYSGIPTDFIPHIISWRSTYKEAGRSTWLYGQLMDLGENAGIEMIILRKDKKTIKVFKGDSFNYEATHLSPGTHTYNFIGIDKGLNVVDSKDLTVSFTGEYRPPVIDYVHVTPQEGGKVKIGVSARDKLNCDDRAGLNQVVVYANGEEIGRKAPEKIGNTNFTVKRPLTGEFTYEAVVRNNVGLETEKAAKPITFTSGTMSD